MSPARAFGVLFAALVLLVIPVESDRAQSPAREPETFLRKYIHLTDAQLATLQRGEVVEMLVDPTTRSELAVFGAVRLTVPKDHLVSKVRDIVQYKKHAGVLQIGKFSVPPRLEDLAGLTLDPDDVNALRKCKPGNCGVRMPAAQIERFRTEVDWKQKDAAKRAIELARRMLLQYVTAYLAGGDSALVSYNDQKRALDLAAECRSLMEASPYLTAYVPEFKSYLERFPGDKLAGTENFVYWSKENFGLKPVISVTHMTILSVVRNGVTHVVISSKQIYASRYFDSSFALSVFVEEVGGGPRPASYLMYLNRSRTDQLGGILGSIKRSIAEGRMVRGVKTTLQQTKDRLEREYLQTAGKSAT